MDAAPWLQDVGAVKQPPSLDVSSSAAKPPAQLAEKRTRPQKEQPLNCPRCNSTSTKFCYFNNYSLTQPRYFCKTCRRYWTEGGSLRNVPVGGGSRKNKRSSSSSSAAASSSAAPSKKLQQDPLIAAAQPAMENPNKYMEAHDLNLGFSHHPLPGGDFPRFPSMKGNPPTVDLSADGLSALELLRSGVPRGMGSPFMTMAAIQDNTPGVYPHGGGGGYMLQEFRPGAVAFPLDGIGVPGGNGSGYENMQDVDGGGGGGGSGGRVMFPFEDLSQVPPSSSSTGAATLPASGFDQRSQADSSGFWNRVMGGGGATW